MAKKKSKKRPAKKTNTFRRMLKAVALGRYRTKRHLDKATDIAFEKGAITTPQARVLESARSRLK
jgi:hypothetical protein